MKDYIFKLSYVAKTFQKIAKKCVVQDLIKFLMYGDMIVTSFWDKNCLKIVLLRVFNAKITQNDVRVIFMRVFLCFFYKFY